jgi:hypothetical protein
MARYHWNFEARDEYDKGREDERFSRHDWEHDKYSHNDRDRAYFDGREDYRREEKERQEEQHREEEYQAYLAYQQNLERQAEEEQYYEQQIPEEPIPPKKEE